MDQISNVKMSKTVAQGVRKVITSLKRNGLVPKGVRLEWEGKRGTSKPKRKNPARRTVIVARRARVVKVNARKRNIAAGFYDEDGYFHPIRASYDYSRKRTGEAPKRKKRNPGFVDAIRPGDRVSIINRFGQVSTGKAVMRSSSGGWVLNMGGPHGTPGLANDQNIVRVVKPKSGSRRNPPRKRLSKKEEFKRRMRLGKLRAARKRERGR